MDETRTNAAPAHWTEALYRAEADVKAGRVYEGEAVRQRLRDSIRRMQTETDEKAAHGD